MCNGRPPMSPPPARRCRHSRHGRSDSVRRSAPRGRFRACSDRCRPPGAQAAQRDPQIRAVPTAGTTPMRIADRKLARRPIDGRDRERRTRDGTAVCGFHRAGPARPFGSAGRRHVISGPERGRRTRGIPDGELGIVRRARAVRSDRGSGHRTAARRNGRRDGPLDHGTRCDRCQLRGRAGADRIGPDQHIVGTLGARRTAIGELVSRHRFAAAAATVEPHVSGP